LGASWNTTTACANEIPSHEQGAADHTGDAAEDIYRSFHLRAAGVGACAEGWRAGAVRGPTGDQRRKTLLSPALPMIRDEIRAR